MDPSLISSAVQLGAGLVQAATGAIQKAKAKRIARSNPRPDYRRPQEIDTNQAVAESRAGQGLSDGALQVYDQSNDRALTSSIEAVTKGGGSVNNIGAIYGNNITGRQRMVMLDEEMRSRNIKGLIDQNNEMAGYKDKEWQIDVFAPYADKAQAAATLAKQSSENIWKGVSSVGSAVGNYATGQLYKNEADRVFGEQQRVNDAYISSVNKPEAGPQFTIENNNIVPIGPQFKGGTPPAGGEYNWKNFGDENTPKRPASPYGDLMYKYPGLMYGTINSN
jgi:hypothetical protein